MNKNTENVVMVALPPTLVAAIVLAVIAAVAFRMGQPTAGFVFSLLSVVAWIALLVEFWKRNEPNEHQKRIAKLMRKATRLRPKLETYKIRELMAEC